MPARGFADGPVCECPEDLAGHWDESPEIRERVRARQRLMKFVTDDAGNEVYTPTLENMALNICVLKPIIENMGKRGRVGADPIEVLTKMTMQHYKLHEVAYKDFLGLQLKTFAYSDAWAIKKMLSKLRCNLPKHSSMRVPWLSLAAKGKRYSKQVVVIVGFFFVSLNVCFL